MQLSSSPDRDNAVLSPIQSKRAVVTVLRGHTSRCRAVYKTIVLRTVLRPEV